MLDHRIVTQIYRAFVLFGAKSDLLGMIGSWGDTLSDDEILAGMRDYNDHKEAEALGIATESRRLAGTPSEDAEAVR